MAASDVGRVVLWIVAIGLLIGALVVTWDATNASRYLPTGLLIAAILLIAGIAIMVGAEWIFPPRGYGSNRGYERFERYRSDASTQPPQTPRTYPPPGTSGDATERYEGRSP
ncbi:MAG: hypothetical protein ACYDDF_10000 [Thermoplasmatota archaeon]